METLRAYLSPLAPFFAVYLTAMLVERLALGWRRRASAPGYDWGEATTNVVSWLGAMVAWIPLNLLTFFVSGWLWQYRITDLGGSVGAWLLAALAWDLSFYWQHRAEHEVRLLWAGHVTHHSGERFNYSTGFRQSWTPWTGFLFYPAWALFGVRPSLLFISGGWNLVYQFFLHTELVPKLPAWIEAWLNTPSHHRVHHAKNPVYWNRNFGGALIVWDRLFGSFAPERAAPAYGIPHPVRSRDPLWLQLHEYVAIARDCWRAPDWRRRFAALVREGAGPGVSPYRPPRSAE
jgi:sterol desaturase/sphingolipid hydroxylase (fatty acid hydroxylase superfamily)